MSAARDHLRLLNPDAVVGEGDPQTYAEALVLLHEERARAERLSTENGHLKNALGTEVAAHRATKAKLHKDLYLHKDYAAVERLWNEVWKPAHPKAREHVPEDWLKLALARLKDFDEAALARALYGAIHNPPAKRDGGHFNQWDNALRNTGNVLSYIERADQAEGKAHRERERHPEVARVLGELRVGTLEDLGNRCDNCGELMILHPGQARPGPLATVPCDDPDDAQFRFDRSCERREARR